MKKKIIICISTICLTIITTILIVILYSKFKSNYIICSLLYENESIKEDSKIKIFFKDSKVTNYLEKIEIVSSDKDLLNFISDDYKSDKYKIEIKDNKIIASKKLSTTLKYNELIKEYTKVGYNCK